jgi:O-antigen ligase
VWLTTVLLLISWGALAFGSPYPWAYQPLFAGAVVIAVFGIWVGRRREGWPVGLIVALTIVALAIATQLFPFELGTLDAISPNARTILSEQNLLFSAGELQRHPISIAPSRTWLGLTAFLILSLLLIGAVRALTRAAASRLAAMIAMLGVVLATIGIVQRATFNGKIYGFWEMVQGGTPFGPYINRNHFAGWMLMAIPVVLGYFMARLSSSDSTGPGIRNTVIWLSTPQASRMVLSGFAIALMALSLVLTMSRSGMLCLVIAFALTFFFVARREDRPANRIVVFAFLIAISAAIVSWVGLDQVLLPFRQLDFAGLDQRPAIWRDAVRIARDFWMTGSGLNTFGITTLHYQTSVRHEHLREAHNDYLQIAAEGGLLVALPIAVAVVVFCLEIRKRLREDMGSIRWIRMGAITGLMAIACQSIVEFSLQMPGNAVLFTVVAALAVHDGRRVISDAT